VTGPEHYKEAERLLDGVVELYQDLASENDDRVATANAAALNVMATMAHTHATLALAAATAVEQHDSMAQQAWSHAMAVHGAVPDAG